MKQQEQGQKYPLIKKYLVKRKKMRQQLSRTNNSMFSVKLDNQLSTFDQKDPFKKYQTVTTNLDNSVTLAEENEENVSMHLKTEREGTQQVLPRINNPGKLTLGHSEMNNSIEKRFQSVRLRARELSHHHSDPLYVKIQKTVARRVMQKFNNHNRGWMNLSCKRKSRSILERSYLKTEEMLQNIRVDAHKRKNTTNLQQMLRNNINQKIFIVPAIPCRQIVGLKGKGGKVIPLFEELYMAQQIFKKNCGKQF